MNKAKLGVIYVGVMFTMFFLALLTNSHILIGITSVMFIALFYYALYEYYKEIK